MEFLVKCEHVSKYFPAKEDRNATLGQRIKNNQVMALEDINFTLNEGDRLGVIGLNGAGKSTLLKLISGIIRPSKGQITTKGKVTSIIEPNAFLNQDFTGLDNIYLQAKLFGFSEKYIRSKIDDIIEFSELGDFIHQPLKGYSTGMSLRLSFAIYKELKPDVFLLDEILSAGDITFRQKIRTSFGHIFTEIPALMLVSHQIADISAYCNRCLVMNNGRLEFDGDTEQAIAYYYKKNLHKNEDHRQNELIKVNKIELAEPILDYRVSESVRINIQYTKYQDQGIIDPLLYVSSSSGPVLTDCPIYRVDFERGPQLKGEYTYQVEIPAFLLNKGQYYVSFQFGNIDNYVMELQNELTFRIIPDEWEKDRMWNLTPEYPVRPHLKWNIDHAGNA